MRAHFPANQEIQDSLNEQQRKLYAVVTDHYVSELSGQNPRQLLLNLDGVAGTSKTIWLSRILFYEQPQLEQLPSILLANS